MNFMTRSDVAVLNEIYARGMKLERVFRLKRFKRDFRLK